MKQTMAVRRRMALLSAVCSAVLPLASCGAGANTAAAVDPVELASGGYPELDPAVLEENEATGLPVAAENDRWLLCVDFASTAFALVEKETGRAVYSDPLRSLPDVVVGEEEENRLRSSLVLTYNDKKAAEYTYTTAADCVPYGQFQILTRPDGVRIVYTLGKDRSREVYPPVLDAAAYERIAGQVSETKQDRLASYYTLLRSADMTDGKPSPYVDKAAMLAKYPALKERDLYVLGDVSAYQRRMLGEILEEVDFTYEDMADQMEKAGYRMEDESVLFTVPLDLCIDGEGLRASVDASLVSSAEGYALHKVALLYGLGATPSPGNIVVPDGSGALIATPSGETDALYSQRLYGEDAALSHEAQDGPAQQAVLPFIALSTDDGSLLASVESGAAMASVCARPAGEMNPLAVAYTEFILRDMDYREEDTLVMEGAKTLLNAREAADMIATVRYSLTKEPRDYSQLAVDYRRQLLASGRLAKNSGGYPFLLDLVGCIDKETEIAGIAINRKEPLTTFSQAGEIVNKLADGGVEDVKIRYLGAANGGLAGGPPNRLHPEGCLGGIDGLTKLTGRARVYPDAGGQKVYADGWLDGFLPQRDAARRINGQNVSLSARNPATQLRGERLPYYLLSPASLTGYMESLRGDMREKGIRTVSFSTLGGTLTSDFRRDDMVSREEAAAKSESILRAFHDEGFSVMVDTGNLYALPYADTVAGLPAASSGLYIESRSVPFVQIVLHGYVEYGMTAFNTTGGSEREKLRAMETGGLVYYRWMWADNLALKRTDFEDAYALHYADWLEEAVETYRVLAAVMQPLADVPIRSHHYLTETVTRTVYENGTAIYVNAGAAAYDADGVRVEAGGYAVREGGGAA